MVYGHTVAKMRIDDRPSDRGNRTGAPERA
jgi:hypothetical protein